MPPATRSQTRGAVANSSAPSPQSAISERDDTRRRREPVEYITNDASWVPSRSSAPDEPPKFTIDLSLPPEERYLEVCASLRKEMQGLASLFDGVVGYALRFLPIAWVHVLCKLFLRRVYDEEENRELQGISKATGVDMYLLVCFNTLLDLLMGCSSGGAMVRNGETGDRTKMVHFRTLDWGMPSLRRVVVQLDFKHGSEGPVVASAITYAGFVGVITGVRKGFSESLNFRPCRNDRGKFWADARYYWHLAMVLLGRRPGIASVLRGFLLSSKTGSLDAQAEYNEIVKRVVGLDTAYGPLTTTACYLCFSDGNETTVIEKDRITAVVRSSTAFIVITNSDVGNAAGDMNDAEEKDVSTFAAALEEIVGDAKDRKECAERNWQVLRAAKLARSEGGRKLTQPARVMDVADVIELAQKFPTTNEMTHYACVLDPREGAVSWCRRWKKPPFPPCIQYHVHESRANRSTPVPALRRQSLTSAKKFWRVAMGEHLSQSFTCRPAFPFTRLAVARGSVRKWEQCPLLDLDVFSILFFTKSLIEHLYDSRIQAFSCPEVGITSSLTLELLGRENTKHARPRLCHDEMTDHVPMAAAHVRVPFAPLDNPRLQHLTSMKNRQNGILTQKSLNGKMSDTKKTTVLSPSSKRAFEPAVFEDFDSENVDPAVQDSPTKKTKTFTFSPVTTPAKSMAPPQFVPARLSTPARANMLSPRAPVTAPAGRSPKRKMMGISKNRRVSAPFSRIDPPFASRGASSLPFSLDAALSGTFNTPVAKSAGATIQESMPKNWFFDVYEDTPEEEAANLMEHSTLTLDLSSDEEGSKAEKDDRGKENCPPEGYDGPTASRGVEEAAAVSVVPETAEIVRRKVATEEMDDGERSPLSDLETEPFFPEGLDKDSHVVVDGAEKRKLEVVDMFSAPVQSAAVKEEEKVADMPVIERKVDVENEVVVWEDGVGKEGAEVAA